MELIEGEIHVTPPANGEHEEIVSEVTGQVRDHRKDLGRYTGIGLFLPGASVSGKVEPDIVLAPKGSFDDQAATEPSGEDYGAKAAYKLGEVVPLPDPLGFDLDTGRF
ncbi:hypothetical protein GCM10010273_60650 [Streptomyces lavendulocolor]